MLTLVDQLRIDDFTVYRDVINDGGTRSYSSTFYAIADAPRLARDGDGPAFDFLWYRSPPTSEAVPDAGGVVTVTVELGPTADEREDLVSAIRAKVEPLPTDPIVAVVPFHGGSVELTFAGDAGDDGGDLATLAPRVPASLLGNQRATFVVPLTGVGAGLLWQALEAGTDLFHARYELLFTYRLDDVSLRVWCDSRRAHDLASAQAAAGVLDVPALTATLIRERVGGVELMSTRMVGDAQRSALEDIGSRLLAAAIAATMVDATPSGAPARVRTYSPSMDSSLNLTFEESRPVEGRVVSEDMLRIAMSVDELGDHVRLVEPEGGFFRILEVKVVCTVNFEDSPVESVRVVVSYEAPGDTAVHRSTEFVFRAGVGPQTFRTDLATPDQRAVSYEVEMFYRDGGPPLTMSHPARETELIVLDLDGTGVLQVDVALRDVPADADLTATVELGHEPSGSTATFVLDGSHPSAVWTAVTRDRTGPYRYRVIWSAPDGRQVATDWVESHRTEIELDAPPSFRPAGDVHVVAAGAFENVAELMVELRTVDPTPTTLRFTVPGQMEVWHPTSAPPTGAYEVRQWIIYTDGARSELPWEHHDTPVLVVGDLLRFGVVVTPRLLDIGGQVRLATVELVSDAADGSEARSTLVFRDAESQTWSFRMPSPDRHTYSYRLTLVHTDGSRELGAWRPAESGVLVLQPTDIAPEN